MPRRVRVGSGTWKLQKERDRARYEAQQTEQREAQEAEHVLGGGHGSASPPPPSAAGGRRTAAQLADEEEVSKGMWPLTRKAARARKQVPPRKRAVYGSGGGGGGGGGAAAGESASPAAGSEAAESSDAASGTDGEDARSVVRCWFGRRKRRFDKRSRALCQQCGKSGHLARSCRSDFGFLPLVEPHGYAGEDDVVVNPVTRHARIRRIERGLPLESLVPRRANLFARVAGRGLRAKVVTVLPQCLKPMLLPGHLRDTRWPVPRKLFRYGEVSDSAKRSVPIQGEKAGLLIGKGGANIKALRARTGCRIQLLEAGGGSQERTVVIAGPSADLVDAALAQILQHLGAGGGGGGGGP